MIIVIHRNNNSVETGYFRHKTFKQLGEIYVLILLNRIVKWRNSLSSTGCVNEIMLFFYWVERTRFSRGEERRMKNFVLTHCYPSIYFFESISKILSRSSIATIIPCSSTKITFGIVVTSKVFNTPSLSFPWSICELYQGIGCFRW